MKSRAQELFDRIKTGGKAAIDRLIADAAAEELFLDFKNSNHNGAGPNLHADDARNLSRAISGFGNAEGGVVVWGIDSRAHRNTGAVQNNAAALVNAGAFRAKIESAISRSTTPAHPLVENIEVLGAPGGTAGYVATHIPKAEFGPIRAIGPGGDHYFIRAGDSFTPIPHDALAGLFGRRPRPVLWPQLTSYPVRQPEPKPGTGQTMITVAIGLFNKGPVLARRPYVSVHPLNSFTGEHLSVQLIDGAAIELRRSSIGNVQVVAKEGVVVAPGGMQDMCTISFVFRGITDDGIRVEITVGADEAGYDQFEFYCTSGELATAKDAAAMGSGPRSVDLLHANEAIEKLRR